ncbi:unnamed protein product, partial [Mesorhabditis spiculigera]
MTTDVEEELPEGVCAHFIDVWVDPSTHPFIVALCIVIYSFVFVLGFTGNMGLIVATFRYRSLQTQWYFGELLCMICGGLQAMGVFIGTFSLCAIAVDRYFRLCGSPGNTLSKLHAVRITAILWVFSTVCTAPYVYHMELIDYKGVCGKFCSEKWSSHNAKLVYTIFVLIIQFVVPFLIMTICYHSIFSFLRRRAANRLTSLGQQANLLYVLAATAGGDSQQHKEQLTHLIDQKKRVLAQKRRVTVILVSMVLIFGITSLPHNIVSLLLEHDRNFLTFDSIDYQYIAALATHFLAMLSCVANPFLYAFLNPEFRELIVTGLRWGPYAVVRRTWQPTQTTIL